ncbi:MAG: hypothetical protein ACI4D8_08040 [Wujia sp.]
MSDKEMKEKIEESKLEKIKLEDSKEEEAEPEETKKSLDDVFAGTAEMNKTDDGKKATVGLKIAGIMSIVMAVVGGILVFICVYHLVIKPSYVKENTIDDLCFPYIHTSSDAYTELVTPLVDSATDTDATGLDAE